MIANSMTSIPEGAPHHVNVVESRLAQRSLQRYMGTHPVHKLGPGRPLTRKQRKAILRLCKSPESFTEADMSMFQLRQVYMYICMYMRAYMHAYTHAYIHAEADMSMYPCYTYICKHVCDVYAHIHTCMHTLIHTRCF